MSVLITRGHIVTADREFDADIYVEQGKIAAVGPRLSMRADKVLDASGVLVIPGGVDVHTHMEAPVGGTTSSDDFESGTRAAAFGGTTCIIDFATQGKGEHMMDALKEWWRKGEKATIDYGLHLIVTDLSVDPLDALNEVVQEGVTSVKLFMAYPGVLMMDDASIFRVMQKARELDALVCMHAENGQVIQLLIERALAEGNTGPLYHALTRPALAEAEATRRAVALAAIAGAPLYIVHISCAEALEEVARARSKAQQVFAETCPQYLFLSSDDLKRPHFEGAKYVLTPPLRPEENQEILWKGLREGDLQVVSTDHCPFYFKGQKDREKRDFTTIPNGGPGVENRMQLMYHYGVNQGRVGIQRWVELTSTAPARLFGLYPRKGEIAVDSDADLVLWDPNIEDVISARTHHMQVDYSLYEGFSVRGAPRVVLSRGEVIVENGTWLGARGRGRFLKREGFSRAISSAAS
jgi:dihydropyrimidinase